MNIEVDQATIRDIPQVLVIAEECKLSFWSSKDYAAEIERTGSIFLVAREKENKTPIGFIIGRLIPSESEPECFDFEILNIGTARAHRRKGIGRELFAKLSDHYNGKRIVRYWLEVRSVNETAIAFYKHLGFKTAYVRKGYYRDPVDDANVMSAIV